MGADGAVVNVQSDADYLGFEVSCEDPRAAAEVMNQISAFADAYKPTSEVGMYCLCGILVKGYVRLVSEDTDKRFRRLMRRIGGQHAVQRVYFSNLITADVRVRFQLPGWETDDPIRRPEPISLAA